MNDKPPVPSPNDDRSDADRLDCVAQLAAARSDASLDEFFGEPPYSTDAESAAYELAVALGWCRLCAVPPAPCLDGELTAWIAVVAARQLCDRLRHGLLRLDRLLDDLDAAIDEFEEDELVCSPLELRMDAWACFYVVVEADEGREQHAWPTAATAAFTPAIAETMDLLDEFDERLRDHVDELSLVVRTRLLENWRTALAAEWHEAWPWWLDGTLEETADDLERQVVDSLPEWSDAAKSHRPIDPHVEQAKRWCEAVASREPLSQALAAASDDERVSPRATVVRFRLAADEPGEESTDDVVAQRPLATLRIPSPEKAGVAVLLEIDSHHAASAGLHAGDPVLLCNMETRLRTTSGERGGLIATWGEAETSQTLRQSNFHWTLVVGAARRTWQLVND